MAVAAGCAYGSADFSLNYFFLSFWRKIVTYVISASKGEKQSSCDRYRFLSSFAEFVVWGCFEEDSQTSASKPVSETATQMPLFTQSRPFLLQKSVKDACVSLSRSVCNLSGSSLVIRLASGLSIIIFAVWGVGPLMQRSRRLFLRKSNSSWKRSEMYSITTSYIQPLLLWAGVFFICRALEPVVLASEASQIVKHRVINFIKSLSTMLVFAHCLSRITQQAQRFFTETNDPNDSRNMGFLFASRAIYTAVWVASISLFMELLGFSTQKWLTAGGLGTVLLTLAGREILTNFLSSLIIHATRPFVLNEWIQTKIEGYEVSGTVERVGWWSPTIIRGDDREAIYIPNHKFTVTVLRNLSQKTHWRVKTHIAISHLDVGKINNIVADMRKVLSKNPQVEQQKLHRRVFLEDVNPENQALVIMISCFVKTSRFEEYLCVKEGILLDLLRVVSHHRARLATPVRTIQKLFTGAPDLETQFSDSVFTHGAVSRRSLLLVEPSYKVNGDDKMKKPSSQVDEDEESMSTTRASKSSTVDSKSQSPEGTSTPTSQQKQETKQPGQQAPSTSTTPSLEDNIILGVALDGSKRTLPIDEETPPTSTTDQVDDTKELAAMRSSNGPVTSEKDKGDPKRSSPDQMDQQDQ